MKTHTGKYFEKQHELREQDKINEAAFQKAVAQTEQRDTPEDVQHTFSGNPEWPATRSAERDRLEAVAASNDQIVQDLLAERDRLKAHAEALAEELQSLLAHVDSLKHGKGFQSARKALADWQKARGQ